MKARCVALALVLSSCTTAQLDAFERYTGQDLSDADRATLVALPDAPMQLDGTHVVTPAGTIELRRARHCDEWRDVMISAGFTPSVFDAWASAVMYRESKCRPGVVSRTHDFGLMQINQIVIADMRQRPWLWGDVLDALGHVPSTGELLDPATNALVAHTLYSLRGAAPWA